MARRPDLRAAMKQYLQVVFHRKWYFILPFLGVFMLVTVSSFFMQKVYRSSNLVLVEQVRAKNPLVSGLAVATTVKGRLATIKEEISSRTRVVRVIKSLGLDRNVKNEQQLFKMIRALQNNISVELVGQNMIKIACEGTNPLLIKTIVDTTTAFFIRKNIELESREVETAIHFIQSQLDVYKQKLDESETILKDFSEINMIDLNASPGEQLSQMLGLQGTLTGPVQNAAPPQSGVNVNLARLIDFQNQLLQLDVDLQEAREQKLLLETQLGEQQEVVVSEVIKESSPVVKVLRNQLSEMEMELATLLVDATADHPRVIELQDRIALLRGRIEDEKELITASEMSTVNPLFQELKKNMNDVDLKIRSLSSKQENLQKLTDMYRKKIKELPQKELDRAHIMREYQMASSMYNMLLERLETARVTKRLELLEQGTTFEVLDEAKIPVDPVKPRKGLIAVLGLILGVFVGAGMVFLVEYADSSFKGTVDAREFFTEPVLGIISQMITEENVAQRRLKVKRTMQYSAAGIAAVILIMYLFMRVF